MKLPSGQNSPQPSSVNPSQKPAVEKSSAQAAQILAKLDNTWVKVEKSEPLTKEQSQQALNKSALNGQKPASSSSPDTVSKQAQTAQNPNNSSRQAIVHSQLKGQNTELAKQTHHQPVSSQPLNEADVKLAAQLNTLKSQIQALANNQETQLKLTLLTLKHNSGSIRLLSPTSYPVNTEVLIKQDAQGAWALHKPASNFSLNSFALNHASILSKPLALFDIHQTQSPQLNVLDKLNIQLPKLTLSSTLAPNSQNIQTAIKTSGQFFEQQLRQALSINNKPEQNTAAVYKTTQILSSTNSVNTAGAQGLQNAIPASIRSVFTTPSITPTAQSNTAGAENSANNNTQTNTQASTAIGQNFNEKLKQVESQINKWVQQLLPSDKTASQAQSTKQVNINAQVNPPQGGASQNQYQQSLNINTQASLTNNTGANTTNTASNQDMKAWLINSQQQLVTQMINNAQSSNPQDKHQEQQNKLQQLSSLFTLLLQPKTTSSDKAISIWPSNLSAQQQLTLLLAQQAPVLSSTQKEQDDISRLLLNISQQLNRLQGEQVNNRLHQQQNPESNQLQMSLPYLHEEQVHWCQMEWQGEQHTQENQEQAFSWHLVLRFAQHQNTAFAIESQMMQNQLHITLWAEQQDQLKHLHQHMNVLQKRLTETGFNVSSLKSKHGMPPLKNNPISSSLVDVHT